MTLNVIGNLTCLDLFSLHLAKVTKLQGEGEKVCTGFGLDEWWKVVKTQIHGCHGCHKITLHQC